MLASLGPRLAVLLGVIYLGFGVAEVLDHRDHAASALVFWGLTLLGGSALVLAGVIVMARSVDVGRVLVAGGAVLGAVAVLWTIVVPVLALAVVVFAIREPSRGSNRPAGAGMP